MHTKPFFPFYQGNKESTAPTEALFLPLAHQQPPPQTLFQNSREQSNTFPKTLKSGFVPAFAIHCTMNLQPQSSFAEVINTFTESSISSLDLVDRETILPSPVLVFCVWVLLIGWLMLMGFFSSLSFFSLWNCAWNSTLQRRTGGGRKEGWQCLNWDICTIPLHSIPRMSLKGGCHLNSLDMLQLMQRASNSSWERAG